MSYQDWRDAVDEHAAACEAHDMERRFNAQRILLDEWHKTQDRWLSWGLLAGIILTVLIGGGAQCVAHIRTESKRAPTVEDGR